MLLQEDEELRKLDLSANRSSSRQREQSNGGVVHTALLATDKGSEAVLRKMLIDSFIEQAQLCKTMNSLTCNAIISKHDRAR